MYRRAAGGCDVGVTTWMRDAAGEIVASGARKLTCGMYLRSASDHITAITLLAAPEGIARMESELSSTDVPVTLGGVRVSGVRVGVGLLGGDIDEALLGQSFLSQFDVVLVRDQMTLRQK